MNKVWILLIAAFVNCGCTGEWDELNPFIAGYVEEEHLEQEYSGSVSVDDLIDDAERIISANEVFLQTTRARLANSSDEDDVIDRILKDTNIPQQIFEEDCDIFGPGSRLENENLRSELDLVVEPSTYYYKRDEPNRPRNLARSLAFSATQQVIVADKSCSSSSSSSSSASTSFSDKEWGVGDVDLRIKRNRNFLVIYSRLDYSRLEPPPQVIEMSDRYF